MHLRGIGIQNLTKVGGSQPLDFSAFQQLSEIDAIVEDKPQAYFRGRKLRGRNVKVPQGYRGIIVKNSEETKGMSNRVGKHDMNIDEDDEEPEEETGSLEEVGSFDEVVVWGHESVAEADDPFVKGMDEWINFAEAVSVHETSIADESYNCGR